MKRTNQPTDITDKRVAFWTKRINVMLEDHNRSWAHDTLKGIKKTIQETRKVSDKQIQAIRNIQNGKNQGGMGF